MNKMVATITVLPRPGTTEQELAEYLRTTLGLAWDTNPVALVTDVAVSAVPDPEPLAVVVPSADG